MPVINKFFFYWRIAMEENNTKKESRECGKGEVIRRGANIQKYVDNYDRIFRKGAHRSTKAK